MQLEDDDTDDDGDDENVEEDGCADVEKRKVRTLVRRLLHNVRSFIRQSVNWAECIREGDPTQDQLPEWEDLPVAGRFKVAQPGSRNSRAPASDSEKETQREHYSKYLH